MEQPRLEKEIMVMLMLSSIDQPSVSEIAARVHTSTSTIYRYIRMFKENGFVIEKRGRGLFHVVTMPTQLEDFRNLVYFTEEEAYVVNSMIASLDNSNALKQNLMKKLASIYRCTNLASFVYRKEISANIRKLNTAIEKERKVILHDYSSSHSHTVRDRLVEPYDFTTNYTDVWCFDLEARSCKTFKVARIGNVELLDERWEEKSRHYEEGTDVFRMHGHDWEDIVLEMGIMAKNLLIEEYPLAEHLLTQKNDHWILETKVCAMEGVGRFVISMAAEIRIIKGDKLRKYVGDYVRKNLLAYA